MLLETGPDHTAAAFAMYQLKFAIITPALITGAFAERIRFNSYIIFLCLFSIFIFSPLAHATGILMVYCQSLVFWILPEERWYTCRQDGRLWHQHYI